MARGIWKNGLLKIFLTRSCLGSLFRPLMYSREETIHFEFLCPFVTLIKHIIQIPEHKKRSLLYYWMVDTPQTLFEELFLGDESGQRVCSLLDYAENAAAVDIAYLTQGYVWDCLERLLKTDSRFRNKFAMDATELHKLIYSILGRRNPAVAYQQWFSNMSDRTNDLISEGIQRAFLEKLINELVSVVNTETGDVRSKSIKAGIAFCLWKIINAKYLTIAMLDEMEQGDGVGAETEVLSRLM